MPRIPVVVVAFSLTWLTACGSSSADPAATTLPDDSPALSDSSADTVVEAEAPPTDKQQFPDVVSAEAREANGSWTFDVTLSSPYDSPERYADAWRVVGPDGTEYGIRILGHDHANEQPFTRSQSGIEIPDDIDVVTIEARDLLFGWGGESFDVQLRS